MFHSGLITENQLDEWVRGNAREAQGRIVELVWRLIAASSPGPKDRRFPLSDSIGQPGPDGILYAIDSFEPFVPEGKSFWEIGTGIDAGAKATKDYRELTESTPDSIRHESTFVFVTPLSGRRDWQHTWKEDAQAKWLEKRKQTNGWQDVRIIDGSKLIDWLHQFPAVERWLAEKISASPVQQVETVEHYWAELMTIGDPPPLTPHLFLANRDAACEKLNEIFSGTTIQLKIDTHFPNQVVDFVSAYVANMDDNSKLEVVGRCLIISSPDAWNAITSLQEPHFLIANFNLDESDTTGTKLLQKARKGAHAVIFAGLPGGIPHPNRVTIPSPKSYQIKETLEKTGYKEERARMLAQKSNGNLSSLLRCLQNLSLMPEWAQGTDSADLVIAELLGSWKDNSEADRAVAEKLSGKSYGDWIGGIRDVALRSASPLIQREGIWKFVLRYEGWYALGPRLFDEQLRRLKEVAVTVLRERNPMFELSPHQRFAASIHGKVLEHSGLLRHGLAESLALLGSHSKALTSCSIGHAEDIARFAVREILEGADWILWGSLNNILPLLAEASPEEFLDAVEAALTNESNPFATLFTQEGNGITGSNYMTGLLWALESLAWDSKYLTRVVVILGELSSIDPGGNWANRPFNSLTTILLPWLPQTCATVQKRQATIETLQLELPEVAWKLLLALLPSSCNQVTVGSHKPSWREIIPDDWTKGVTIQEYMAQIAAYSNLAINASTQNHTRLAQLIDRLDDLPDAARNNLLSYLSSDEVISMPETERLRIWSKLVDLVAKHKKYSDADWAMTPAVVDEISTVTEKLAPLSPNFRHQRLFSERDFNLYEERGNYEEARIRLENRRKESLEEVFTNGGIEAILQFARSVETPWRVGFTFNKIGKEGVEASIIPQLLVSETKALAQFIGGFIRGRFHDLGWKWVDDIDMALWTLSQKGQLLMYLPFTHETWVRVTNLLGEEEHLYWSQVEVNPYESEGNQLEWAIDRLIQNRRPNVALKCAEILIDYNTSLKSHLAVRVLQAVLNAKDDTNSMDLYSIIEVIKALQSNTDTNPEDLLHIEWAFLPILDRHYDASPKLLEQRLADNPEFFCEVIRVVFRSNKEEHQTEVSEQQENIATNAYTLLSEWRTPPGTQEDGTFNGEQLMCWLNKVKAICSDSGHLEVAYTMIGHVLTHTPPDPGGLWLHNSVATVLNSKDTDNIREGYITELYNSRGVHTWTAGREEQALADKYRKQAEDVEMHGFYRIAASIRKLANSYEKEAEKQASREPFED